MRRIGLAVVLVLIVASCVVGPHAYRIEPADYLWISVSNNEAMSRSVVVRSDGKISLPLINDIQAAGLTPFELGESLSERLKDFVPSPEVSVVVIEVQSFKLCTKEPTRPGCDEIERLARVLDDLARSGGVGRVAAQGPWVMWWIDNEARWELMSRWDTQHACETALPRYIVPEDGTLLVNAIVFGWFCWPGDFDPRRRIRSAPAGSARRGTRCSGRRGRAETEHGRRRRA